MLGKLIALDEAERAELEEKRDAREAERVKQVFCFNAKRQFREQVEAERARKERAEYDRKSIHSKRISIRP